MTDTINLGLPYIAASQAQKHVTHNEALRILDAAVQLAVLDATRTSPPAGPAEGQRHIVATSPTGAWSGRAKCVAVWQDGGWAFLTPKTGWRAWSIADGALLVYDGALWRDTRGTSLDNLARLGVNTSATSPNLLSVRSNAALFAAINAADSGSGDVRIQLSKEAAAKTASLVFADAYSARAEFGLTGDDDFHFKVSADGTTWRDALVFDRNTARASFPNGGVREALVASRIYYVRTDGNDANTGLANTSGGAFLTIQKAINTVARLDLNGNAVTIQVGAGTYTSGVSVSVPFVGGVPLLQGDATTPGNVSINVSGNAINVSGGAELSVSGLKLAVATAGSGLSASGAGRINVVGKMEFAACATSHIHSSYAGQVFISADYTISGGSLYHWWSETAGGSISVIGRTITLSGTPAFSGAFANATIVAQIIAVSNTFSGGATGARYAASLNGVILSAGATFPGSTAGSVSTGGQYN